VLRGGGADLTSLSGVPPHGRRLSGGSCSFVRLSAAQSQDPLGKRRLAPLAGTAAEPEHGLLGPKRQGCDVRAETKPRSRGRRATGRWRGFYSHLLLHPPGNTKEEFRDTTSEEAESAGPAHVATVSFLASRVVPSGGFFVALAGGVALARVAQRCGARLGYGASAAAMLETVAIMGPPRLSIPFTQAATAPMLGRLEARSVSPTVQVVSCTALRVLLNALGVAFFIWVVGGLETYAGSYDAIAERFGFNVTERTTVYVTLVGLLVWGVFASTVQVWVYRRGLRDWRTGTAEGAEAPIATLPHTGRFDPRAVALATAIAFGLLLASTEWVVLVTVAGWVGVAWLLCRPDNSAVTTGLALAALLASGALIFTLTSGLGVDLALRRAARAGLLVLVAAWLRAAAGADGMREVFRRGLGKARRVPAVPEAAQVLDGIGSEGRLMAAGRSLADSLEGVRSRPMPLVDAVLGWVVAEASRFRSGARPQRLALRLRPVDGVLVAVALASVASLLAV
jgi:lipoprotein signal peptidase